MTLRIAEGNWHHVLQVGVVLSLVAIFAIEILASINEASRHEENVNDESFRNERSTPRSFILPATPGVAFKQEQERDENRQMRLAAGCVAQLRERGFNFDGLPAASNASFSEALFKFQNQNGLPTTGKLDEFTEEALRCRS